MIRVLIVEDQRMAREDMENHIQSSGRYCLEASITNAAMAETVCRQSRCELVLMDVCTEDDESGLVAAERIKKTMPQIKVIIVTSLAECSFIERAHKAGVESFWYKDAGKEELLEVMDRTMKGEKSDHKRILKNEKSHCFSDSEAMGFFCKSTFYYPSG